MKRNFVVIKGTGVMQTTRSGELRTCLGRVDNIFECEFCLSTLVLVFSVASFLVFLLLRSAATVVAVRLLLLLSIVCLCIRL